MVVYLFLKVVRIRLNIGNQPILFLVGRLDVGYLSIVVCNSVVNFFFRVLGSLHKSEVPLVIFVESFVNLIEILCHSTLHFFSPSLELFDVLLSSRKIHFQRPDPLPQK